MAENGGGQELENLLITVDSEIGNLKGIESAINALQRLQGLTGNAKGAIKQLGDLGVALKNFDGIGSKLNGIDNVTSGVHRMITALQRLTQVTGSATKAIGQLGKLGTTLNSSFNGIGQNLAGIENVSRGVLDLVTAVERLSQVTGNANGATRQLGNLGKSLQSFDNVNLKNVADNIAEPLERIMKAIGNLGNNNTVSIKVDQSGIANVNQINRNVRRTMTTFREFYDTLQTDRANVGQLFGDMFDISQPTEDLQRNLNRAQRMLGTFENSARSNAEKVRTAMSNFATRDLLNNQSFRNAFRASRMNEAMAEEMRTQISNMRSEIETRGQQEINDAWTHVHQAIRANIQHFNLGDYMNFDLPLDQLRANLRRMENELARSQRMMESARTNLTRLRAQTQDVNALHGNEGYRGSFYTYATQTHHIREYTDAIQRLQAVIRRQEIMPQSDVESLRMLPQLIQQLERYQQVYQQMQSVAEPSDEQRNQMVTMERAIDILAGRIDGIHNTLEQIPETEEGILERMRQIADEAERTNRALEQSRNEMMQNVGGGFTDFGNALSGTNIPVLKEIGQLSSLFGRNGVRFLDENALAGLGNISSILGTISTAIGQITAVLNVAIAYFQVWWKTINKAKEALTSFLQSCIQFAKNMLTHVVGAFNSVSGAVSKVVSMVRSGAQTVATAMRKMGDAVQSLLSILGKIGGALAPAMKGVTAVLSTITPRFVKNLASSDGSLKNIIKNTRVLNKLLQTTNKWVTMLTRMLMRKIVQAFISGLKQAFEDLVLFEMNANDSMLQLNNNVSLIFSGLRRAANQWVAAFEPLINFITPMVVGFLEGVQTMGEAFAKFMAILTGQPYYIRAKLFYQNYGEEVEKANNKVKNLTNGLDELNILNDNKDNDSGIKPEDMFEKVYIDDVFELPSLQEFIDKIVDWLKNIDWEKIWEKIREIIHKAMEIINEILSRLDLWEWLGKTLGNLFNTLMVAWNQFITDFDPKLLADALTTFIINALQTINWELIHENIELTAKKFAQFWNEIFGNQALWDEIAKAITNLLNEIVHYFDTWAWTFDFAQMAQTLTDAIIKVLTGFDYEQLRHAIEGWVKGLVAFINTAIANKEFWSTLGESLAKIINSVIIEAFKDLGDIDFSEAIESLKLAIEKFIDGIDWDSFWVGIDKWAQNIADVINGIFADDEFLTKVAIALGNLVNGLIELIDESLIKLKAYDIGAAIAKALAAGMENIHWNTIFMIPADAINALNNAIRGFLDSLPEDFSLADWLIEHLSLTYDTINWELLEQNLYELGDRVVKFINDIISSDDFWSRFGELSIRALNLVVKITEDFTQLDWEGFAQRVVDYVNRIINENKIDDIIRNLGEIGINLFFTISAVIEGVEWDKIGEQIAQGIGDIIEKLYVNSDKIQKAIEDAFTSFSELVSSTLKKLLKSNTFYMLGTIIAKLLLGIINGLAIFFDENSTNIVNAMKQFADGMADFIHKHRAEIIASLNKIIDGIVEIMDAFFDEKGKLWTEINAIIEKLNLGKLIGSFIRNFLLKILAALKTNTAISNALKEGLDQIAKELAGALKKWGKYLLERLLYYLTDWKPANIKFGEWIANKIKEWLGLDKMDTSGLKPFSVELGEWIADLILGKDRKGIDLSKIFDKLKFTGLEDAWNKLKAKWEEVKAWFKKKWQGVKDFFGDLFGGKEAEVPVTITPTIDDKDTKHQLEDVVGNVELQFEDAKLGKIKADEIEVTLFKGDKLEVEDIYAQTLTVVDIFAEKLHVGEIDGDMETIKKDMEDAFGGNRVDAEGGVLGAKRDAEFDKILARLLEITEKITVPLVEVAENITTPLIEAVKVLTDLIDAKKIKTKLLDAKKMTTKLLEAEKMWTKFLEIRDKIWTRELEVEERTTTKVLEVDEIVFNNDSLGELSADIEEVEKLVIRLIEAAKLVVDELEIGTLTAYEINVSTINADTLNVKDIYADTLTLGTIVADSLKVSSIDGGSISGGSTGGTGITNIGNWGYGGTYTIEKPQFVKGDRWSDISGAVPSAEDFLAGFADAYEFGSDAINDAWQNAIQTTNSVQTPRYLGSNTAGYNSGSISSGSPITLDDVSLPAEAQYIKDYLTRAIGNEKGALGLLGNLYAESGLRSNNLQDTANTSLGLSDEQYTSLVNGGRDFTDNKGYGLAQWTTDDRKQKLQDFLDGRSIDDLGGQLEYLVQELQTDFPNVWKTLQNASSIHEASSAVLTGFEKPKNQGENQDALRWHYGEVIGRALQGTEIPDEDVPTADTPDSGGDKDVDEFNVIGADTTEGGGLIDYPWSFLESLPIQTEFTMAEVYNIIDTWLGRIYKLLKSFKVDDFLKDLLDLKEIELDVDGLVGIKELENIEKTLEKLNDILNELSRKLDELLNKGIECNCTCDGGDDTHLINNTNAKSENTRAVEELNNTMRDLIDTIGNGITAYVDDVNVDIGEISVDVGDVSAVAEAVATADADAWAKALDGLKDIMSNVTCHCDCDHEIVCQCNCGGGDFDGVIHSIQNALGNITCNCNCNCNCGDCAMGHGGGTSIPDEPTPTGYTPYTPSGGTGRGGYDPYPYYPSGGSSYDPTPSTPSGGTGKGGTDPIGRTSKPSGNSGDYMKWIKNGITKPLYITLDGVRHLVTDTLPDTIKNRILNGEGKYDLDGTPISRVNDKEGKANSKNFWLNKIRDWWKDTNNKLDDVDDDMALYFEHDGMKEMLYAVVNGQRIALTNDLDDHMKKLLASGVDDLGNKIEFMTDTMVLDDKERNLVLQYLHQKGWDKLDDIKDKGDEILKDLDENANKIGDKVDNVKDNVEKLDTTVKDNVKYLADNADKNADAINGTLNKNSDAVLAGLGNGINKIKDTLDNGTNILDNSINKGTDAVKTGIASGANNILQGIGNGTNAVLGGITNGTNAIGAGINGLGGKVDGVKNSVNGLGGKIDGVNNSVNGLGGKVDGVNNSVNGLGGKVDGVKNSVNGLGGKIDGVNNSVNGLGGKVDGVNNSVNGLGGKLDSVNNGISGVNNGVNNLNNGVNGLNNGINNVNNGIGNLNNGVNNANNGLNNLNNGMNNLNNGMNNLNNGMNNLNNTSANGFNNLNNGLNNANDGLNNANNGLNNLNNGLNNTNNGLNNLNNGVNKLGNGIENLSSGMNNLNNGMNNLNNGINAVNKTIGDGNSKLSNNANALNNAINQLHEPIYKVLPVNSDGTPSASINAPSSSGSTSTPSTSSASTPSSSTPSSSTSTPSSSTSTPSSSGSTSTPSTSSASTNASSSSGSPSVASLSELDSILASAVDVGDRDWSYHKKNNTFQKSIKSEGVTHYAEMYRPTLMQECEAYDPPNGGNFRPNLTLADAKAAGFNSLNDIYNLMKQLGSGSFNTVNGLSATNMNDNYGVAFKSQEFPQLFAKYKERFMAKGYVMGGMPNAGEIFVARENGTPEFVGSFGGHTAVANNDQIVTAVANGVSMANDRMVSAIENQTNALETAIDRKNLDVQIGDRQIAEANNRGQKGLGNKFVD